MHRKLIELNLHAAKRRESPQTGYIHLSYEDPWGSRQDTIPLLENFCHALALLRSRLTDHVCKAKTLLEKLLIFESEGNFPVYLHQYPRCADRAFSLHLLPIFYWILKDYSSVIGSFLKEKIESSTKRIVEHGKKTHAERPLPWSALIKLQAFEGVAEYPDHFRSPKESADYLIALQMVGKFRFSRLPPWHASLCVYQGSPQAQEWGEPQVTLFDLFMGYYWDNYSQRALKDHPVHLLAALIHPFSLEEAPTLPAQDPTISTSEHLMWGNTQQLHSLLIAGSNEGRFHFSGPFEEGKEEAAIFCNLHPDHRLFVNGTPATAFSLHDQVSIVSGDLRIELSFTLSSGEGQFRGFIARGNRPGQLQTDRAWDWKIGLRAIARSTDCTIAARLGSRGCFDNQASSITDGFALEDEEVNANGEQGTKTQRREETFSQEK